MKNTKEIEKVWDPLVRIGHWMLVVAFFTAYFTEEDLLIPHVWAGYTVSAVVLIRVLWGFVGSSHARFSDFVYSPAKIFGYLKNLAARKPQHYIGHNPAGGAMVLALLISLAGTSFTGLELYAVKENKGPLALAVQNVNMSTATSILITEAKAESDDEDQGFEEIDERQDEDFMEDLHEVFANFTLLLVLIHIAGVIVSSFVDKEKLVKAMFTGKKEIDDSRR